MFFTHSRLAKNKNRFFPFRKILNFFATFQLTRFLSAWMSNKKVLVKTNFLTNDAKWHHWEKKG